MAHLIRCWTCKMEYRCDREGPPRTCCFDDMDHHFCQPCTNVDCKEGMVARTTLKRLRANPCPECKNLGMTTDENGRESFCSLDCEACELLWKDLVNSEVHETCLQ